MAVRSRGPRARTPGLDHSHEDINLPSFLYLLPSPGRSTLDLACGEGRLGRLLASVMPGGPG